MSQTAEALGMTDDAINQVERRAIRRLVELLRTASERPTSVAELLARGGSLTLQEVSAALRAAHAEHRPVLRRCLDRLTERQRRCLELRVWQNQSIDRTATLLGMNVGSVKETHNRIARRVIGWLATELGGAHAVDAEEESRPGVADPHAARSPEENRFRGWYEKRADESAAGSASQSLGQYARMHSLSEEQLRRWLAALGADPGRYVAESDASVPHPRAFDTAGQWLDAVRIYLALTSGQMDDLIDDTPGTYHAIELGITELTTDHLRAVLRGVPDARSLYTAIAHRFHPDLADQPHIGAYLQRLRLSAGILQRELAAAAEISEKAVSNWENEDSIRSVPQLAAYLRALTTSDTRYSQGSGTLGASLRFLRMSVGLTIEQLCDVMHVPSHVVVDLEAGRESPAIELVTAYVRAVTPGAARYPEGYSHLGEYLRYLREAAGWTRQQLADRVGLDVEVVRGWETTRYHPAPESVAACLRVLPGAVPHHEVVAAFPRLPRTGAPLFPSPFTVRTLNEYLRYFDRLNRLGRTAILGIFGTHHDIRDTEVTPELSMLRVFDRIKDRAGVPPWHDFAEAWGYRYRMDPVEELPPDPDAFDTFHEWFRSNRLYLRKTQLELSADTNIDRQDDEEPGQETTEDTDEPDGYSRSWVSNIEILRKRPSLRALRVMRDAELISDRTLAAALRKFYVSPAWRVAEPAESLLFEQFVTARVGSAEERRIRNQICLHYEGLVQAATRRWAIDHEAREELAQRFRLSIMATINNHTPSTVFAPHAWVGFRGVAHLYLLERKFPNLDRATRAWVGKVDLYIARRSETGTTADDAEIAQATGLTREQVTYARQLRAQRAVHLDAPFAEQSSKPAGSGSREVADPARPGSADVELRETIHQALADLPESDKATALVDLCHLQGLSVDAAAARLGIEPDHAQQLLGAAMTRLHDALTPQDDPAPQDRPGVRSDPGDGTTAHRPPSGHTANQCPQLTARVHKDRTGRTDVIVPTATGLSGQPVMRCAAFLHGHSEPRDLAPRERPVRFPIDPRRSHLPLARAFARLVHAMPPTARNGVSVVVFDGTHTVDGDGVSGHMYRLEYHCDADGGNGYVELDDPGLRRRGQWRATSSLRDLQAIWAMAFDRHGRALPLPGAGTTALPRFNVGQDVPQPEVAATPVRRPHSVDAASNRLSGEHESTTPGLDRTPTIQDLVFAPEDTLNIISALPSTPWTPVHAADLGADERRTSATPWSCR